MILKESFSIEHIDGIKTKYPKLDKQLIERAIFAFGLLESFAKVNMPFIFKGGTSLMLLLEKPFRLSTDIDIMVDPSCDIDHFLKEVGVIYPFLRVEEHARIGKNAIVKKHYKYYYKSPTSETEIPILLDVVFERSKYDSLISKEIRGEFLLTDGVNCRVQLPSIESMLGDKLTAFAPHTTGIEFEYVNDKGHKVEKTLEVMKQFLDASQLINEISEPLLVRKTYDQVANDEIKYRGINITPDDCLKDTFKVTLCLLSRGSISPEDYRYMIAGIGKIQNHVFGFGFNGEAAYRFAAPVLLFVAKMITRQYDVQVKEQPLFNERVYRAVNQIRKLDRDVFNTIATAIRMVDSTI